MIFDLIDDTAAAYAQQELEYQHWLESEAWLDDINLYIQSLTAPVVPTEIFRSL